MTPQLVFKRYEEIKGRLPQVVSMQNDSPVESVAVQNLQEIADDFDVFLFDAFGVLNVGETPIFGAPERFLDLQSQGKSLYVLTNSASYEKNALVQKFSKLGYEIAPENIISSREVLIEQLKSKEETSVPDGGAWGTVNVCDLSDMPTTGSYIPYFANGTKGSDAFWHADAYIFLSSVNWTPEDQKRFLAHVKENPKPIYVGNPDLVAPREDSFSLEPGYFAHEILDETDCSVSFFGKPFGNTYDYALGRIKSIYPDQSLNRILMLGDTLHTDILGGHASGIKTALITDHGTYAGQDVGPYISKSKILPDYIMPSI